MKQFAAKTVRPLAQRAMRLGSFPLLKLRQYFTHRMRVGNLRVVQANLAEMPGSENFREMAFTFAIIALAAKIIRVDGDTTQDEFLAFCEAFPMPATEHEKIRTLFSIADNSDSLSCAHYARQIVNMFPRAEHEPLLQDVLVRLVEVAGCDGAINAQEEKLLREVAQIFGISRWEFSRIVHQPLQYTAKDPFFELGISAEASESDIKKAYHRLVRDHHPDAVQAIGGSAEAVLVAQRKLAAINAAYEAVKQSRIKEPQE